MLQLNLPAYAHQLRSEAGKLQIFDPIRKKYIHLTPEEWVRQHLLNLLTNELKYPASRTKVEGGLTYNLRAKRTDILIYDEHMKPLVLAECKAPHVELTERTIEQLALYNKVHQADLLILSNGIQTLAYLASGKAGTQMLQQIPTYNQLLELR